MKCNLCNNDVPKFLAKNNDHECPACHSLVRHRALIKQYDYLWSKDVRIMHVGPHVSVVKYFIGTVEKNSGSSYIPVDIRPNNIHVLNLDIGRHMLGVVPCDIVICKYVLECVSDDNKALENIVMALKPGGVFILDTPLKEGANDRPALNMITSADVRVKRFGAVDRFRQYGRNDIRSMLESFGLNQFIFDQVPADAEIGLPNGYEFIKTVRS